MVRVVQLVKKVHLQVRVVILVILVGLIRVAIFVAFCKVYNLRQIS